MLLLLILILGIGLVFRWYYHRITMEIPRYKIRKERHRAGSKHRRISQQTHFLGRFSVRWCRCLANKKKRL